MLCWEPEGCYRHRLWITLTPLWFSLEQLWTALTPFWLSTDEMCRGVWGKAGMPCECYPNHSERGQIEKSIEIIEGYQRMHQNAYLIYFWNYYKESWWQDKNEKKWFFFFFFYITALTGVCGFCFIHVLEKLYEIFLFVDISNCLNENKSDLKSNYLSWIIILMNVWFLTYEKCISFTNIQYYFFINNVFISHVHVIFVQFHWFLYSIHFVATSIFHLILT